MDLQTQINVDGFVVRHNAHLVAKGFTQVESIGFNEFFSHVAWMESIWDAFAIATIEDLEVHQMDVKIIFLNVNISKEIFATTRGFCGQR